MRIIEVSVFLEILKNDSFSSSSYLRPMDDLSSILYNATAGDIFQATLDYDTKFY